MPKFRNILFNLQAVIGFLFAWIILFRVHLVIAIFAAFLLAYPQTVDEMVALINYPRVEHATWRPLILLALATIFLLFLFPVTLWFTGRWLSYRVYGGQNHTKDLAGYFIKWAPRILAVSPLLFLAWNLIFIRHGDDGRISLNQTGYIVLAASFGLLTMFHLRSWLTTNITKIDAILFSKNPLFLAAIAAPILITGLVATFPVQIPQLFGVIPFGLGFLMTLAVSATGLVWHFHRNKVPIITLALLIASTFAILNWNDNHEVKLISKGHNSDTLPEFPTMPAAFEAWLGDRVEKWGERHNKPFPVFVIAAEGGGIYAAQNAAVLLSRLDDLTASNEQYEKFSDHIFAISALSGGAVGATIYGGLLAEFPDGIVKQKNGTIVPMEEISAGILNRNLLAPVVANMVTLDFFQRFIPRGIFSDRALALEGALLRSWSSMEGLKLDEDILLAPASGLWSATERRPALVLNTTEMNTGRAVASAPFKLGDTEPVRATFREILGKVDNGVFLMEPAKTCNEFDQPIVSKHRKQFETSHDLSAITAAVLSARFPYASPPGRLVRRAKQTCPITYAGQLISNSREVAVEAQYVDGGYVEASSVEAALEIVRAIEGQASYLEFRKRMTRQATQLNQRLNKLGAQVEASEISSEMSAKLFSSERRRSLGEPLPRLNNSEKIEVHLVTISLGTEDIVQNSNTGEVLTPPLGLLATWGTRSRVALENARQYFSENFTSSVISGGRARGKFFQIEPYDSKGQIPLGWRLSSISSKLLRTLLSEPEPKPGQTAPEGPGTVTCRLVGLVAMKTGSSTDQFKNCLKALPFGPKDNSKQP